MNVNLRCFVEDRIERSQSNDSLYLDDEQPDSCIIPGLGFHNDYFG